MIKGVASRLRPLLLSPWTMAHVGLVLPVAQESWISPMRRFGRLVIALVGFAFIAASARLRALAVRHACLEHRPLVLRDGPGTQYHVTGELGAELHIKVLRCEELWCLVDGDGGRGWTYKHSISFGLTPDEVAPHQVQLPQRRPQRLLLSRHQFHRRRVLRPSRPCHQGSRPAWPRQRLLLGSRRGQCVPSLSAAIATSRAIANASYASQPVLDRYLRRALSSIRVH